MILHPILYSLFLEKKIEDLLLYCPLKKIATAFPSFLFFQEVSLKESFRLEIKIETFQAAKEKTPKISSHNSVEHDYDGSRIANSTLPSKEPSIPSRPFE